MMRWFWELYMGPDGDWTDPRVSPLRAASLASLPPTHVVVAEFDPLLDEGLAYARALEAAGVDVALVQTEASSTTTGWPSAPSTRPSAPSPRPRAA